MFTTQKLKTFEKIKIWKLLVTLTLTLFCSAYLGAYLFWQNKIIYFSEYQVYAPRCINMDELSEANKELIDFPNKINGAKTIEKYLIKNAKFVLVHIRSRHSPVSLIEDENKNKNYLKILLDNTNIETVMFINALKKIDKLVEIVQADIEKIVLQLINDLKFNIVYLEGITKDNINIYTDWTKGKVFRSNFDTQIFDIKNSIPWDNKKEYPNLTGNQIKQIRIEELEKRYNEVLKYRTLDKLARKGTIIVLASEDEKEFLEAHNYDSTDLSHKAISETMDDREDACLQILAQDNNTIKILEFGGGHAWGGVESCGSEYEDRTEKSVRDNIAIWNKNNTDKKFSLIEITPTFYDVLAD